jgi:hypothetical protein
MTLIMVLAMLLSFIAWAVIGFLLWIPLLLRTVVVFSVAVAQAAFSGQHADNLREPLRIACGFWIHGFRIIKETLFPHSGQESRPQPPVKLARLLLEIFWAACVWLVIVAIWQPHFIKMSAILWEANLKSTLDQVPNTQAVVVILFLILGAGCIGFLFGAVSRAFKKT